ncbi:MAG: AMP-binding protein [Betaproteobacteria bacterium]|nr:AMP-binding protein [Betaproteobacteria bacterium]
MNSLAHRLKTGAEQAPEAFALLAPHGRWTYAELAAQALKGGAFLRDKGFGAHDIAAIAGGAGDLALAAVACAAAGIALFPLDPANIGARWPALAALGGKHLRRISPLPGELPQAGCRWPDKTAAGSLALVIATSGSEGFPKAVMLTHANLDGAAAASNARLPLTAGDCWLACLPLHHIGGISTLYRCIRAGATLSLHEGFDAARVWRDLHEHPITHLSLVPAMLARLLDIAAGAAPPPALRHALIGGAALSRPLVERARAAGWPICPSWGMSECAAQVATLPAVGDNWREGDVGAPLPGFRARVDAGGRIRLRGPQVMAGYLNPDLRPGDGLEDGWLLTADLGRAGPAGNLTIFGRADDVFNSGGVKVHPLEVESCLAACPGVTDVAVTALPDPVWGDLLAALVVGPAEPGQIARWSERHLPSAQRPRRLLKVERLPRNAMGKIERSALRAIAGRAETPA